MLIEDADRLTEGASNALLKAVEEPPPHTVFLLCAPSNHPDDVAVTIRSRCRVLSLRTPSVEADRRRAGAPRRDRAGDRGLGGVGVRPGTSAAPAGWRPTTRPATSAAGARSRARCARARDVFAAPASCCGGQGRGGRLSESRDAAEIAELKIALGAGGTGKGRRGGGPRSAAAERELERRQKSRATRTERDVLDRALVDLAGFYRDVVVAASASTWPLPTRTGPSDVRAPRPPSGRRSPCSAGWTRCSPAARRSS